MDAKEVKERLRLEDVLDRYGISKTGNRYLCPFHNDSKPSMTIKNENYRCWACGASGDAITFAQEHFGLNFGEALARLNSDFSLGLSDERPTNPKKKKHDKIVPPPIDSSAEYVDALRTFHRVCIKDGHDAKAEEIYNELNLIEGANIGI